MGEPEESAQALPRVTVELETLRQSVLRLQQQLAAARTVAAYQQVQAAAADELRALAPYTDMLQALQLLIDRAQQRIDRLTTDPA
jgi:predicted  nucleic acid-binding Zn-ribbon protein